MMRFWGMVVLGVVGAAILLALGTWQVKRLAWKEAILADIETRIAAPPVQVPLTPSPIDDLYLPVRSTGVFSNDTVRVLVSQKIYGAGYRLISPFQTTSGRLLLVDRGFVSVNIQDLPTAPEVQTEISGNLHWPSEIDGFTPENDLEKNVWFSRDVATLAQYFKSEPVLIIARNIEDQDPRVAPLPVSTSGIPNDHLQYALTWFALALIWVGMSGYFLYRQRNPKV